MSALPAAETRLFDPSSRALKLSLTRPAWSRWHSRLAPGMLGGVGWLLFVLFVSLPFVDLVLLLRVGDLLGFWPTVALTLGMGALGAWLSKREGLRVWRAWTQALAELRTPEEGIIDGVLVIAGGALLMAPGVLTDVVGFLFLIPVSRRLIARGVRAAIDRRIRRGQVRFVNSSFVSVPFDSARPNDGVVETTGESVGDSAGGSKTLPPSPGAD